MSKTEALLFLGYMIGRLGGGGYHPDEKLSNYVCQGPTDLCERPSFSDSELAILQPMHDQMVSVLGDESYTLALALVNDVLPL